MTSAWLLDVVVGDSGKFRQLEHYASEHCQPFATTFASQYLIVFQYTSVVLVVALFIYGARRRELWPLLLGVGLSLDYFVNRSVAHALRVARPVAGCGAGYALPAYEPEHAAFVCVSLLAYTMQWRAPHMRLAYVLGLVALVELTGLSTLYFNFARPLDVLAGAVLGTVTGAAWQLIVFGSLRWHFDALLARVEGTYSIDDTYCVNCAPRPGDPPPLIRIT